MLSLAAFRVNHAPARKYYTSTASPAKEPLSWKLMPAKAMYAWHANRRNLGFAAVVELPNLCWRAKIKRDIPVDPKSPRGGIVPGQMCGMVVVECAAGSIPEPVKKNFAVGKDSKGSRKVTIAMAAPSLPKNCPTYNASGAKKTPAKNSRRLFRFPLHELR